MGNNGQSGSSGHLGSVLPQCSAHFRLCVLRTAVLLLFGFGPNARRTKLNALSIKLVVLHERSLANRIESNLANSSAVQLVASPPTAVGQVEQTAQDLS